MSTYLAATMYMDREELRYHVLEEGKAISITFSGLDNMEKMETRVFFDEDDTSIAIRSWAICKVPEDKKDKVLEVCSNLNKTYRWVKFFIDPKSNTVDLAADAIVNEDTVGPIVDELVHRAINITDDAYPELMKAIWG